MTILRPWWLTNKIVWRSLSPWFDGLTGHVAVVGAGLNTLPKIHNASTITTLDLDASANPNIVCDVTTPPKEIHGHFDSVLCLNVLEHVTDPVALVEGCRRIMRQEGTAIFCAPFVYRVHSSPIDFWRFTPDGLAHVVKTGGLDPQEVRAIGGFVVTVWLLFHFALYEATKKRKMTRWASGPVFAVSNLIGLLLSVVSRGGTLPHECAVLARKE